MIIDGFGGPGGWDVAAARLGLTHVVGLELDAAACATRAAAGHRTIRCDIASLPVEPFIGKTTGQVWSPVCTTFSAAGKRGGVAVTDVLDALIRDLLEGGKTRAAHRREMARLLRKSWWPDRKMTRAQRSAAIWKAVRSASLVAEPARFIYACRPEWVAMEQVPSVLPLWKAYAEEMRKLGYSCWVGKLNSADYGVPQTRERAILIASRVRRVQRPYPTHYDPRKGAQMFGTPWISMAEALGMGATARPSPTVTAGGTATGGAEPFGHRDRDALAREQEAGDWVLRRDRGSGLAARHGTREDRSTDQPAPSITSGGNGNPRLGWALRIDAQAHATVRDVTAPAPALKFGHSAAEMQWVQREADTEVPGGRSNVQPEGDRGEMPGWVLHRRRGASYGEGRRDHPLDEPAPTVTGGGSAAGSGNGANLEWRRSNWAAWVAERPATTIQGDPRAGRPGESQFAQDSVRITVAEAAALQAFPPGYPWQGTRTKQYEQVGNAVPPLMVIPVLGEAAGIPWEDIAAAYRAELTGKEQAA